MRARTVIAPRKTLLNTHVMRYVFFTKQVRGQSVPQLIETVRRIGASGVDMAVRDGYPVNPDNVRAALPAAVKRMRAEGLDVPLATPPFAWTDPASPQTEAIWAACHDAQVPNAKVGCWSYEGRDYWKAVDHARRQIEGFEKLAQRFGVKACMQTHSGNYLGVNASAMMHLVRGFNPAAVGVYLDPGHLALNGEPLTMAFDMASEYLALVAVKDSRWVAGAGGVPRRPEFVPLGTGGVDWREMMRALFAAHYDGPLSFHSEYENLAPDALIEQTKRDISFVRRIEAETRTAS